MKEPSLANVRVNGQMFVKCYYSCTNKAVWNELCFQMGLGEALGGSISTIEFVYCSLRDGINGTFSWHRQE